MLKRLLLYLNSKVAQTLPPDIVQKSMAANWKNQWSEWRPDQMYPDTHAQREAFLAKRFEPTLSRESCIVELGCANARYLLKIAPGIKKAYAFDISPTFLQTAKDCARERGITNVTFIERDLQQWINKPDGLPDIEKRLSGAINDDDWEITHVFVGALLMYFAKDEDALKMFAVCNRLLPKTGHLLLRETLVKDGLSRKIHSAAEGYMAIYRTYEEYRAMIEQAGFKIECDDAIGHEKDTCHHSFLCSKITDTAGH